MQNLKPLKISEHFGGIHQPWSGDGYYIRDSDHAIILVEGEKVLIGATNYTFEAKDDAVSLVDWKMLSYQKGTVISWARMFYDEIKMQWGPIIEQVNWIYVNDARIGEVAKFLRELAGPGKEVKGSTEHYPIFSPSPKVELGVDLADRTPSRKLVFTDQITPKMHDHSAKSINRLMLPRLPDRDALTVHMEQVQLLATKMGILTPQSDGSVDIDESIRIPFMLKVQESLSTVSEIEDCARMNMS